MKAHPLPLNNNIKKIKITLPPSTVKSNLQKLQVAKKIPKNEKRVLKNTLPLQKTTCHYKGVVLVKEPPASFLTRVMCKAYVKFKSPPPYKLGVFPFFSLVHWPFLLQHLNISYTKSNSKWIWCENMVEPT